MPARRSVFLHLRHHASCAAFLMASLSCRVHRCGLLSMRMTIFLASISQPMEVPFERLASTYRSQRPLRSRFFTPHSSSATPPVHHVAAARNPINVRSPYHHGRSFPICLCRSTYLVLRTRQRRRIFSNERKYPGQLTTVGCAILEGGRGIRGRVGRSFTCFYAPRRVLGCASKDCAYAARLRAQKVHVDSTNGTDGLSG